jgi:hypothetical protein
VRAGLEGGQLLAVTDAVGPKVAADLHDQEKLDGSVPPPAISRLFMASRMIRALSR